MSCKLIETVFTWSIFKTLPWNKNLSIKTFYCFLLSFFKFLAVGIFLKDQATQLSQNLNENFMEFKNSDKILACASFWESLLSLILLAMRVFWVNSSSSKAQPITSKLKIDDYSNFPTAGTLVMPFYVSYLNVSFYDTLYAEL